MKRDKAILLALLEYIEEYAKGGRRTRIDYNAFQAPSHLVDYHFRLLLEAKLIYGTFVTNVLLADELTWSGHEYLEELRRDHAGQIPSVFRS